MIVAYLFAAHGTQKVFGYPPPRGGFDGFELVSWVGLTGVLETFGGLAVLLGIFTVPVAFILSCEMALVYVLDHVSGGFWPGFNGGDLWFFYCFAFLYLATAGGGAWSLDAVLRGKAKPSGFLAPWEPQLRSVFRIATLFVFIPHGTEDTIGWPWPAGEEPFEGPDLSSLNGWGHLMETVLGPFVLLGLFTRPLAFLFSGEMAIAYFLSHQPRTFWPILNLGEDAIYFSFAFLYFAAAGGGPWALDWLRQRSKTDGQGTALPGLTA
jgi:putative oxidoreductase